MNNVRAFLVLYTKYAEIEIKSITTLIEHFHKNADGTYVWDTEDARTRYHGLVQTQGMVAKEAEELFGIPIYDLVGSSIQQIMEKQ